MGRLSLACHGFGLRDELSTSSRISDPHERPQEPQTILWRRLNGAAGVR
jgi:hypothetical protein